ncbi:MAG TPA: SCO family protein [Thermoanaerobaculia bacterium]|nr:SCO family protein [Thermoanaerobaculia bacterium]
MTSFPSTLPRIALHLAAVAALGAALPAAAQHEHPHPARTQAEEPRHAGADHTADPHAAHRAMAAAPAGAPAAEPVANLDIPDVPVITQDGREVSFYSDLVEGRTVAMNFIFTTCTTICPPMGANFGRLQDELGERLGRDVHLISVSVDPATDTPQRLKAWSEKFGAREGWTLVTGDVGQVEHLLKALQVFTPDVADHAPVALIGDDASGVWTRAYGLAGPKKLAAIVDQVANGDGTAAGAGGTP